MSAFENVMLNESKYKWSLSNPTIELDVLKDGENTLTFMKVRIVSQTGYAGEMLEGVSVYSVDIYNGINKID